MNSNEIIVVRVSYFLPLFTAAPNNTPRRAAPPTIAIPSKPSVTKKENTLIAIGLKNL